MDLDSFKLLIDQMILSARVCRGSEEKPQNLDFWSYWNGSYDAYRQVQLALEELFPTDFSPKS